MTKEHVYPSAERKLYITHLRDIQIAERKRGFEFFPQGKPAYNAFLLLRGVVMLEKTDEDGKVLKRFVRSSSIFGYEALLDEPRSRYGNTAKAATDCWVQPFNLDTLHPDQVAMVGAMLEAHLRTLYDRLDLQRSTTAHLRIKSFVQLLLELRKKYHQMPIPSQYDIAALAGASVDYIKHNSRLLEPLGPLARKSRTRNSTESSGEQKG